MRQKEASYSVFAEDIRCSDSRSAIRRGQNKKGTVRGMGLLPVTTVFEQEKKEGQEFQEGLPK